MARNRQEESLHVDNGGRTVGASERWRGIRRTWSAADVARLRGSAPADHTRAHRGAERLWEQLQGVEVVTALGAMTGQQAVQQVRAGLPSIYVSGWQVAADANLAGHTYPDQGLYPSNSVPTLVRRIQSALARADQIEVQCGEAASRDWFAPIVADAEAGFGGALNAWELTRELIEAGAAGVHFEDQLAGEKKCGHLGGKVLVPTSQFERTLRAARLAADVCGTPTVLIARTDAESATLITSDIDPRDRPFLTGERTAEGYFRMRGGLDAAIARALAYAPWADVLWCETQHPDLAEARRFAEAVHRAFPGKLLAYNCSPSFHWRAHMDAAHLRSFQRELGAMGYRYQFVTLAGFHSLNHGMFTLAKAFATRGMAAYSELQEAEIALEAEGYTAVRHQTEVGTGWFDGVATLVAGADVPSTLALEGSTEREQFDGKGRGARSAPRRRRADAPREVGAHGSDEVSQRGAPALLVAEPAVKVPLKRGVKTLAGERASERRGRSSTVEGVPAALAAAGPARAASLPVPVPAAAAERKRQTGATTGTSVAKKRRGTSGS
jgi:isocitrate lyase